MATVNTQKDEDNEQNQPTTGGTSGISEAGSPSAGGGAGASPVKQNAAAQNQSSYTDVGSYLNANQAGAQKMGEQVAGNLTNRYNQTKTGVQQSANDLINQVNQGYTPENQAVVQQAASDPYSAANNQDTLSQFQSQLNDTYTGPTAWGDYGTQQGNVASAQQYGNLNKTPGGTSVLAQELEGPTASQGVNQLDSLLLRGNEGAATAIQNASDPYSNLNDFLGQQNTAATGAIGAGQKAAQDASQHALDAFTGTNGTYTNLNSTINQNVSKAQADAQAQNAQIAKEIAMSGQGFSPQVLQALGLTPEQGAALQAQIGRAGTGQYMTGHNFGEVSQTADLNDLSGYLSQQDPLSAINAANVATSDQYNQMGAIQKLLGAKAPQGGAINPALASLAGTAPTNLSQFQYGGALGDVKNFADVARQNAQDLANQETAAADAAHNASKQHGIGGAFRRAVPNVAKYVANPLLTVASQTKEAKKVI